MASNTNTARYKQTGRQARIQTREGNFSGGMMFTDKPISDGYSKVLVNYDIDSTDGAIQSRKGYQALSTQVPYEIQAVTPQSEYAEATFENVWGTKAIAEGTSFYNLVHAISEKEDLIHTLFAPASSMSSLLGNTVSEIDIVDTKLVSDSNNQFYIICIIKHKTLDAVYLYKIPYTALDTTGLTPNQPIEEHNLKKYVQQFLLYADIAVLSTGKIKYKLNNSGEIFSAEGILLPTNLDYTQYTVEDLINLQEPTQVVCTKKGVLGTFGWNNDYYYFVKYTNPNSSAKTTEIHYAGINATQSNTGDRVYHPYTFTNPYIADAPQVYTTNNNLKSYRVLPYQPNPAEAATSGFNMLLDNPYTFTDEHGAVRILGIIPYEQGNLDKIILEPVINRNMTLRCYYSLPAEPEHPYRIKWEWREVGATEWNIIQDKVYDSFESLAPLTCDFMSPVEQLILRVTITDTGNTTTDASGNEIETVLSTTAIGLNFVVEPSENLKTETYDLSTGTGVLMWQNRLVVWGVKNAENTVFVSTTDNPGYFPYPNNIDYFNETIVHCIVHGADLLVFTSTALYRLTLDSTGSWTTTLVQKNLQINAEDVHLFTTIKNMLFFKSGNYYYMLVPKASSVVGDTTIAPISNNIKNYLDNFEQETIAILQKIMQKTLLESDRNNTQLTDLIKKYCIETYSYVHDEQINIVYVLDLDNYMDSDSATTSRYIHYILTYDTVNYSWKIQVTEATYILKHINGNTLNDNRFISIKDKINSYGNLNSIYFIQTVQQNTQDLFICDVVMQSTINTILDNLSITAPEYTGKQMPYLKNYQYLDTGYRILTGSVDLKKRFREMQISINNTSQKALTFYTAFIVDGNLRKDMQGYTTKTIIDPEDPRTGILLVERPYIDPKYLPSVPELVVSVEDYINPDVTPGDATLDDSFVLDSSQFPDLAYWKIRVDVSGKGYVPRLQLLSTNEQDYSILSLNWVYRTMNSR